MSARVAEFTPWHYLEHPDQSSLPKLVLSEIKLRIYIIYYLYYLSSVHKVNHWAAEVRHTGDLITPRVFVLWRKIVS